MAKSNQLNFRPSRPEIIEQLQKIHDDSKSFGVNHACEAYVSLRKFTLRDLHGKFTRDELGFLCDIQNATMFTPEYAGVRDLWIGNIEDADRLDGTGEKWGLDVPGLVKKIKGMPAAEVFFMQEEIERFWNVAGTYGSPNPSLEKFMLIWSKESEN